MKTYELTYVISSSLNTEEADAIQHEMESGIQGKGGMIIKSDKLGAQPLSYAISKQGSGHFYVSVLQVEEQKIKEIKESLDKHPKVLRSMIVIKKPHKEVKERRSRRNVTGEFEIGKKSPIMEPTAREEEKKGEKVDAVDLEKKLDEILSE